MFEGGFLGLDNIGVFDRSSPLPTGGYLEQADGTAWMVFFSQQMLRIAVELALHDPPYEEFVSKFFEHTMWIAGAMDRVGEHQTRCGTKKMASSTTCCACLTARPFRLKVRSMVGLLPLAAVSIFEEDILAKLPSFAQARQAILEAPSGTCGEPPHASNARRGGPAHALHRQRRQTAPHSGEDARRE